ncbi:hypothetical protein ACWD0G_24480, partial [Streptomyces goshikiensis]
MTSSSPFSLSRRGLLAAAGAAGAAGLLGAGSAAAAAPAGSPGEPTPGESCADDRTQGRSPGPRGDEMTTSTP